MNHRLITYAGETLHLAAWARRLGCAPQTLSTRLSKGMDLATALTTPRRTHCKIYDAIVAYEARQREGTP